MKCHQAIQKKTSSCTNSCCCTHIHHMCIRSSQSSHAKYYTGCVTGVSVNKMWLQLKPKACARLTRYSVSPKGLLRPRASLSCMSDSVWTLHPWRGQRDTLERDKQLLLCDGRRADSSFQYCYTQQDRPPRVLITIVLFFFFPFFLSCWACPEQADWLMQAFHRVGDTITAERDALYTQGNANASPPSKKNKK